MASRLRIANTRLMDEGAIIMFEFVEEVDQVARIKVVGIGGAGGNAVNRMIEAGLTGVEFLAVNTDAQALRQSLAHQTLQIGTQITRGLGSGGDPVIGRKAVEEDEAALTDALHGCDMVFVAAGMGGGTGTGAAPVVARIARELGALTVAVVTKPFGFEGSIRMAQAEAGTSELRDNVDTLIMIPNQRLLEVIPPTTTVIEAFRIADNILYEATRGIHEIIARPNLVNLDFADVRSVMKGMGVALMGTGRARGENRAEEAARAAISSPLLEDVDIHGARAVLVNLTSADLGIAEVSRAMSLVQEAAGAQAHIMFGYGIDETLGDELQVTVVATGFTAGQRPVAEPPVVARAAARVEAAPTPASVAFVPAPALAPAPQPAVLAEPAASAAPAPVPAPAVAAVAAATVAAPPDPRLAPDSFFVTPSAASPPLRRTVPASEPALAWEKKAAPPPPRRLAAAAAAAGSDDFLIARPAAAELSDPLRPFLTPLDPVAPLAATAGTGGGSFGAPAARTLPFQSDALMADLSEPAYTRKYLD
jgi:cell division protein FtsZ